MGTGAYSSIGNITIYDGSLDILYDQWTPAIGVDIGSKCGKITIKTPISSQAMNMFQNSKSNSDYTNYLIGGYNSSSSVGSIEFNGGKIEISKVQYFNSSVSSDVNTSGTKSISSFEFITIKKIRGSK